MAAEDIQKTGLPQQRQLVNTNLPLPFSNAGYQKMVAAECSLPIHNNGKDLGQWSLKCFHLGGVQLSCLILGQIYSSSPKGPLVRIHSKCFTGDTLGSQRCDCGQQKALALEMMAAEGRGILIYMDGHEGRGIGLLNKIKAYHIQENSQLDTFAANRRLGLPEDMRNYSAARSVLDMLRCRQVRLLTANKEKILALDGIVAGVIPLEVPTNCHNHSYILSKRGRQQQLQKKIMKDGNLIGETMTVPKANPNESHQTKCANVGRDGEKSNNSAASSSESGQKESVKLVSIGIVDDVGSKSLPNFAPFSAEFSKKTGQIKVGIVRTMWNQRLVDKLVGGVRLSLIEAGIDAAKQIVEIAVPGCWEIPWAASHLLPSVDTLICLGVLIRGETAHFDVLSHSIADGLMRLQLQPNGEGVPIVNGILCCNTEEQAAIRCDPDSGLSESLANTAIHMATLALDNGAVSGTTN